MGDCSLRRSIGALVLATVLTACAADFKPATSALEQEMGNPASVEYRDLEHFSNGNVCGYFNASYTGAVNDNFRLFVYYQGLVIVEPGRAISRLRCADDFIEAGIAMAKSDYGLDITTEHASRVRADMLGLSIALQLFGMDNSILPTTRQQTIEIESI
jgi:hypothetical protein